MNQGKRAKEWIKFGILPDMELELGLAGVLDGSLGMISLGNDSGLGVFYESDGRYEKDITVVRSLMRSGGS